MTAVSGVMVAVTAVSGVMVARFMVGLEYIVGGCQATRMYSLKYSYYC